MNKKLMALAVAAAISAPGIAWSDDSTVTLYGTLNADFEDVKAEGARDVIDPVTGAVTPGTQLKSRTRVSSNSSNIGFHGSEPLGGGLNAWFQVENSVFLDVGGGTWASRNSGVGLNGGFGTVLFGNWDSPYKTATGRLDPFGDTSIGAYTAIMGGGGSPTSANGGTTLVNRASFDRRVNNTVQYWTPNFGGFSVRLGYGANEEKSTTSAGGNTDPRLFAASAGYENGPLYLTTAYEEHRDFGTLGPLGAFAQGKDRAWKVGGAFTFANVFTLSLLGEELRYKSDVDLSTSTERKIRNYFAAGTFKAGANAFSLGYGRRQKVEDNGVNLGDMKADLVSARYGYSMSKRTEFYAMYVKIKNDSNASQDFAVNPINSSGSSNAGADPQGFGVGFIHKF